MDLQRKKEEQRERKIRSACKGEEEIKQSKAKQREYYSMVEVKVTKVS